MIKVLCKLLAIALLCSIAAGCAGDGGDALDGEGGRLVRAVTSEPSSLDPQGPPSSGLSLVLPYLFDTLVVRSTDNTLHPLLAESWETAQDGLSVTMRLQEDAVFHDGNAVDAAAVKYTFDRFKTVGTSSPIYIGIQEIESVEVVEERTVRFRFASPSPTFWSTISMPYAAIISPASVAMAERDGAAHIVGSGPFVLSSWESGRSLVMVRNPDYAWGPEIVENTGPPFLESVAFRIIPDATMQLTALAAGEVDVVFINRPEHRAQLEHNTEIVLEEAVLNSLIYLGFNCAKAPLDEVTVRQALAHAVDKQEIVDLALGGMGERAFAPLPPTLQGFDPSLRDHELGHDPEGARRLLAQAGFEPGSDGIWQREGRPLELELLTSTRPPNGDIAAVLQSQLKHIGVALTVRQLDGRAVMQATGEGTHDLLLWRYDWNDPDALRIFLSSDRIGSSNRVYYNSPAFDALVAEAAHELDEDQRMARYLEAQKLVLEEAPWQPLYNPVDLIAIRTNVTGARVGFMGRLLLNDVTVSAPD